MAVRMYDTTTLRAMILGSGEPLYVHDNSHWQALQNALSHGSHEQRKYALALLSSTVQCLASTVDVESFSLDIVERDVYERMYDRFCVLFETVVLARYVNQVQDGLQELTVLFRNSRLRRSWILCLVIAALPDGMQDSIRKIIGSWTLQYGVELCVASSHEGRTELVAEFVETSFLPWATLGSHVTNSVNQSLDSTTTCAFGERLTEWLHALLSSTIEQDERSTVFTSVLKFLADRNDRIFQFSRAFVLQGMANAADDVSFIPDIGQCQLLQSIWPSKNYQELVADLMILQCAQFAQRIPPSLISE